MHGCPSSETAAFIIVLSKQTRTVRTAYRAICLIKSGIFDPFTWGMARLQGIFSSQSLISCHASQRFSATLFESEELRFVTRSLTQMCTFSRIVRMRASPYMLAVQDERNLTADSSHPSLGGTRAAGQLTQASHSPVQVVLYISRSAPPPLSFACSRLVDRPRHK